MSNAVQSKDMSNQTMWNIRDARGLNANEKALLWAIESRGITFTAWQTTAEDAGMKKDVFYRTRAALIKKGLLKAGLRKDDTTVYRVNEKAVAALVPVKEKKEDIVWEETQEETVEAPETPSNESDVVEDQEQENEPQEAAQSLTEVPEDHVEQTEEVPVVKEPSHHEKKTNHLDELAKKFPAKDAAVEESRAAKRMDAYRKNLVATTKEENEEAMGNHMTMDDFLAWSRELSDLGQLLASQGIRSRNRDSLEYIKATVLEAIKSDYDEWGDNANMRYTYAQKEVVFEGVKTRAAQKKELLDDGMTW